MPRYSAEHTIFHTENPTSRWAETFRASAAQAGEQVAQQPMNQRSFADETQSPTHDALSNIYNRGYRGK